MSRTTSRYKIIATKSLSRRFRFPTRSECDVGVPVSEPTIIQANFYRSVQITCSIYVMPRMSF
jgi:hypothetical protein